MKIKPKRYAIVNKDIIKWAKEYDGPPFHCLLTDAPYHLTTITKRFGKEGSVPAKHGKDGAFTRLGKGFMGQEWDGNMISFDPAMWHALGEHMHPGAFGMSFGGSRTAHRIAVAIEDAGFIIHPMIYWVYGSGFPKATRIDVQIDKANGIEIKHGKAAVVAGAGDRKDLQEYKPLDGTRLHEPQTDLARAFAGHRYGMQALKPAAEPIIVFQKPYEGKPIDNIVHTGAGALNIESARIGTETIAAHGGGVNVDGRKYGNGKGIPAIEAGANEHQGRWPANFVIDDSVSSHLDAQSGVQKGGFVRNRTAGARPFNNNGKVTGYTTDEVIDELDGGASRYFYNVQTQLDENDPFLYVKKASTRERNAGLDNEPEIRFAQSNQGKAEVKRGNMHQGNSFGVNKVKIVKNDHPTVKPIDLARYLAAMLLPPDVYDNRRILVPFSGVASEMIGCLLAGWDYVEGVEIGKHYCELAEKRIRHWIK